MQKANFTVLNKPGKQTSSPAPRKAARTSEAQRETLLGYRLWQVQHLWHKHIERELGTIELSHLQYALLAAINLLTRTGEFPSQIRLAEFSKVEKMMVSKHLRGLEQRGLVSRRPRPGDRRANQLELTASGARILRRALAISLKAHATFFQRIGDGRQRLNDMLQVLMESNDG